MFLKDSRRCFAEFHFFLEGFSQRVVGGFEKVFYISTNSPTAGVFEKPLTYHQATSESLAVLKMLVVVGRAGFPVQEFGITKP